VKGYRSLKGDLLIIALNVSILIKKKHGLKGRAKISFFKILKDFYGL